MRNREKNSLLNPRVSFMLSPPFRWPPALRRAEPNLKKTSRLRSFLDPKSPKIQNFGPPKHWPCRQIHFDPSKTTLQIRTLYTALGRGWPRSVHYTWYFGGSLQCYAYSVRIAKSSSDVSRIVVGTTFRFWRIARKSQLRFTHYTRYI